MKHLAMDEFRISGKGFGLAVFGLMALSPIAAVLIPWDFGPLENDYRQLMAGHSLSIILIELLIFIALFKNENLISDFVTQANWRDKAIYDNFGYYPYSVAIFTLSVFMLFKSRRSLSALSA